MDYDALDHKTFDPGCGMNDLVVVILAGGSGTRFWPASTAEKPKQLLALTGERTLLQMSFDRTAGMVPPERTLVITNESLVGAVRSQLPELPAGNVIGEPAKKDTAAAVALSALIAERRFGPCTLAIVTSDHVIEPIAAFRAALSSAVSAAADNADDAPIWTFGIEATYPATGYGYLEVGAPLEASEPGSSRRDDGGAATHHAVVAFHEKPPQRTAERYLAEKERYLWNSGMFVFRTQTIRAELQRNLPAHLELLDPAVAAPSLDEALREVWPRLASVSIDKAVMEKARTIRCVRGSFRWSDVGSFPALAAFLPKDGDENAHRGQLISHDARQNVVWAEDDEELVALVGVEGLVVVRAGKRTLVMDAARAEELKLAVEKLPKKET